MYAQCTVYSVQLTTTCTVNSLQRHAQCTAYHDMHSVQLTTTCTVNSFPWRVQCTVYLDVYNVPRSVPVFRIRIIWPGPHPDPLQVTWIRIQVAKKSMMNSHKNQPKLYLKKKRNHLFCLINMNNKLINYKKTSLWVLHFITEKKSEKLDRDPNPHQNEADTKHWSV